MPVSQRRTLKAKLKAETKLAHAGYSSKYTETHKAGRAGVIGSVLLRLSA